MRWFLALLVALSSLAHPATAQVQTQLVEVWTEEWDPAAQQWVRLEPGATRASGDTAATFAAALAQYGPFQVLSHSKARLIGVTDTLSPSRFARMLRDFPAIRTLEMVECPGTEDDQANLRLGRMIRQAGIETFVPSDGSVRSGAVELFLAGSIASMEDGAEFVVHSWIDEYGRQAADYPADAAEHRDYIAYYLEMGMDEQQARGFYALTNSVPFESTRTLRAHDMRPWLQRGTDRARSKVSSTETAHLDLAVVRP